MKTLILGAGAAGITAAIIAKKNNPDYQVEIIEKNNVIGKKISICGAGRCNVTNSHVDIDRYYGGYKKFAATVLNQFNNKDIMNFLNDLGIELYEEEKNGRKKGKIFPITNQASTVVDLLQSELDRLGVVVHKETTIIRVSKNDDGFVVKTDKGEFESDKLVLATGGLTYPRLGSTGIGYEIAESLGHKIIKPVPSALPLVLSENLSKRSAGMRVIAEVTSIVGDREIKTDTDEVMFTQYGVTGPAILNISREISVRMNREEKDDCYIRINFFPGETYDSVYSKMVERWKERPDQQVLYSLYGIIPNKLAQSILYFLDIEETILNSQLKKDEEKAIVGFLTGWKVKVSATRTWHEGEFTAGGIDVKEIKAESLESKIVPNLHFAGEVINVDGDVGGFNLSWAWASGYVVGDAL